MTVIAAALRELMNAGLEGEALVQAVERIEEAAQPKRSSAADRQARYRERQKNEQSVTRDACDGSDVTRDASSPLFPPSLSPDTPKPTPLNPPSTLSDDFDRFWRAYPKRDGGNPKQPAKDKFARWVRKGIDPEVLIAAAEAYRRDCIDRGNEGTPYVAQAQTWLNQRRWQDVEEPEPPPGQFPAMSAMLADDDADCSELLRIRGESGMEAAENYAKQQVEQRSTAA